MQKNRTQPPLWSWPFRLKAACVHLGLSTAIAALAAVLVFGVWYPTPHREISGGRELFTLLVGVDLVLGPLITLMIFDLRKGWPHLRRDLAMIALLQLIALGYGLHTMFQARPVYLVHEVDRFRVIRAVDIEKSELQKAPAGLRDLPFWGPRVVGTRLPQSAAEQMTAIQLALAGLDIGMRPEYWVPYADARGAVLERAKPLTQLQEKHPQHADEVEAAARSLNRSLKDLRYVPLTARGTGWVALVDDKSAEVAGYAPFDGS